MCINVKIKLRFLIFLRSGASVTADKSKACCFHVCACVCVFLYALAAKYMYVTSSMCCFRCIVINLIFIY